VYIHIHVAVDVVDLDLYIHIHVDVRTAVYLYNNLDDSLINIIYGYLCFNSYNVVGRVFPGILEHSSSFHFMIVDIHVYTDNWI